jgi:hypothetical protein
MIAANVMTLSRYTVISADGDLLTVPGMSVENWVS